MVGILLSYWVSAYFQGRLLLVLGRVYHQPDNPGTDEHGASISVLEVMVCFTSPDVPIPSFR